MSVPSQFEMQRVLRLLQAASVAQDAPAEGHITEDEQLLACWEGALLTPHQRAEIIAHLAKCPRCRAELAAMVRQGQLQWMPPAAEAMVPSGLRPPARGWLGPKVWLAVAATLVVVTGLGFWAWGLHHTPRQARLATGPAMARRGIEPGSPLWLRGKITDYGYFADGQSAIKGFVPVNAALKREREELLAALAKEPGNRALRLGFGELLLRMEEPDEAAQVFAELVRDDPHDAAGRLGLGLACFLEGKPDEALEHFEAVLAEDPRNTAAQLNAAACLARLGKTSEAVRYWERLLPEVQDAALRGQIEQAIRHHAKRETSMTP